jgi:hypothetical protein
LRTTPINVGRRCRAKFVRVELDADPNQVWRIRLRRKARRRSLRCTHRIEESAWLIDRGRKGCSTSSICSCRICDTDSEHISGATSPELRDLGASRDRTSPAALLRLQEQEFEVADQIAGRDRAIPGHGALEGSAGHGSRSPAGSVRTARGLARQVGGYARTPQKILNALRPGPQGDA